MQAVNLTKPNSRRWNDPLMSAVPLDDSGSWLSREGNLLVYIASSLTAQDLSGKRHKFLEVAEKTFREFGFKVYSPTKFTAPGSPHSSEEVYAIDHFNARQADLIFFIRLQPSIGMGIEAQIASDMLIPWADAKTEESSYVLTPLVAALANPSAGFRINFSAGDLEKFRSRLRCQLQSETFQQKIDEIRRHRDAAKAVLRNSALGRLILRQRLLLQMTSDELSQRVDLAPWWIESLEHDQDIAAGLSLVAMVRILDAVGLQFRPGARPRSTLQFPPVVPIKEVDPRLLDAANEFVNYFLRGRSPGEPAPESDLEMLAHFRRWAKKKDLEIPKRVTSVAPSGGQVTVVIAVPMSNLSESERRERKRLLQAIEAALLNQPDVSLTSFPEFSGPSPEDHGSEIYLNALAKLNEADVGIVLASPPATGVGIVAKLMANATLPMIRLSRDGCATSRMLDGLPCRWLEKISFQRPATAGNALLAAIDYHRHQIHRSSHARHRVSERVTAGLGQTLGRISIPHSCDLDEAARLVYSNVPFMRDEWVKSIISKPSTFPTMTLLQFVHLANSRSWGMSSGEQGLAPVFYPSCCDDGSFIGRKGSVLTARQREAAEVSLDNLLAARLEVDRKHLLPLSDDMIFEEWGKFCDELTLDAGDYESDRLVREQDEWIEILSDGSEF